MTSCCILFASDWEGMQLFSFVEVVVGLEGEGRGRDGWAREPPSNTYLPWVPRYIYKKWCIDLMWTISTYCWLTTIHSTLLPENEWLSCLQMYLCCLTIAVRTVLNKIGCFSGLILESPYIQAMMLS